MTFVQVAVTAYQPVDVVTRTVEVPLTRTVDVFVPKPVVREKIVEVPKLVPKYIEKVGIRAAYSSNCPYLAI